MQNFNLKIPLAVVKNYSLSSLAVLVYGEIYGICSKNPVCYITDKTLIKRHHSNKASIQRAISELKKANLIKRLPSYRKEERQLTLLPISETEETINKFILIPDYLLNDTSLNRTDELIYGYLISESKKQEKINRDKHLDNDVPFVVTTKKELAKIFKNSPITINRSIKRLKDAKYLNYESINGKYLEIEILSSDEIFSRKLLLPDRQLLLFVPLVGRNLYQKWVSTYIKSEHRPISKSSIDLYQKWVTNRVLNRVINKDKKFITGNKDNPRSMSSAEKHPKSIADIPNSYPLHENELSIEPTYYDKPPSINDMPPEPRKETYKQIEELNEISIHQSSSKCNKEQKYNSTANSGLGVAKDNQTSNKNTKSKPNHPTTKYKAYNGVNLSYQCNELQKILRSKTGKRYILTTQQPLIEQRLKDGFTLNDFEMAIVYLLNQGQSISIKDLLINISNYKHKINSN